METQVAFGRAPGDLPPRLAAVHSGSEIHHDQGGRVVVKMTDHGLAEAMREHYASHGVPDVDIRIVPHTQRPLEAALLAEARAEPEVFEVIEVDDLPEPGVLTPTPGS